MENVGTASAVSTVYSEASMKGAEIINRATTCFRGSIHHGCLYQAKVLRIHQDVLCAVQPVLCCDGDRHSQQRQWKEDNTADPRRI